LNNLLRTIAAVSGLAFVIGAQAHGPTAPRYRVGELPVPASLRAGCLPGYFAGAEINRVNDFGVVTGNFTCYTQVDPVAATLQSRLATFAAAAWFGAVELPRPADPGRSFSSTINNRGEIFGFETVEHGFSGTRWTLAGAHERLFFDPACEFIQISAATDGNGRYTVGWALRGDSRLPPPVDALCLRNRWIIRSPDGVESAGPLDGAPTAINALNVAVGSSDRSAISYHAPTGRVRVLHASDATFSAEANDINDFGEVVGRISRNASPPAALTQCDPGVAVRWDRDGRERVLPHLPGAVSSRAFGAGYDGETVGDSGAGTYCPNIHNGEERAALWLGARAFDLNTLIPGSAGITLTRAVSINRRGQITASGFANDEPMTQCPSVEPDFVAGTSTFSAVACHNARMYLLTPAGR
jgi:hypothetical protein